MTLTRERRVDEPIASRFYEIYINTFGDLRTLAAARHVMTHEEWLEEMADERVIKVIAHQDEQVIGLATLATDVRALPWLSPEFYDNRFPGREIYYCGIGLVVPEYEAGTTFVQLMRECILICAQHGGIAAFDCCAYNFDKGLVRFLERVSSRIVNNAAIEEIDVQHYYAWDPQGPKT